MNYTAIDEGPYSGVSYYRLKQTDFDGQYDYSRTHIVNIVFLENAQIVVYPNPIADVIKIKGDFAEHEVIRIFNPTGRDITSELSIREISDILLIIDLSNLLPGVYTVTTTSSVHKVYKR